MYQQTSMYNFYKSINPKSQSAQSSQKKHVTTTPKVLPLKSNLKNKKLRKLGNTMKPSTPLTQVKKLSPIKPEVIDVLDSDDETDSKSTISLLESSYENKLPLTPTKDKSLKRSYSDSSSDFSPRKKQLNNVSKELIDSLDSDDVSENQPVIKRGSSCENEIPITPTKDRKFKRSPSTSDSSSSPRKKQLTLGSREVVKHLKHRVSPKKNRDAVDPCKLSEMIENLNESRSGAVPKTHYNLEQYYAQIAKPRARCDSVCVMYQPYDIAKVIIPAEKHALHFFELLTEVFCKPDNCGYFNDQEQDKIFAIVTLSTQAQMLFVRLIKRKYYWRRTVTIYYPEIAEDLMPYFDELEKKGLITSNTKNLSLETLLDMLTADDARDLCKLGKFNCKVNKEICIEQLLKKTSNKPLWPGMESPIAALRKNVLAKLGHCMCLPNEVINLVHRIVTLAMPAKDVTTTLVNIFLDLTLIKEGSLRFPEFPVSHDPVFQDREHLIRYVEQENNWRDAMDETIDTKKGLELGRNAHARLMILLGQNQISSKETQVPRHVLKFREEYVCLKTLTCCLEKFKKDKSTLPEAVQMLRDIISQEIVLQGRKGDWYEQLALIEGWHNKDPETAAILTIEGLKLDKISDTARYSLNKRAANLSKRKVVSEAIKSQLIELMDKEIACNSPKVSVNANAIQGNYPGRKSLWEMKMGDGDKGVMGVERRAMVYYQNNGFPRGWHCEGSLPQTLFTLLMWDEIYSVPVPAAFLTPYQKAPLDLYTSDFYKNRREQINKRILELRRMSSDEIAHAVYRSFVMRQHYASILPVMPVTFDVDGLKTLVRCIGTSVVSGICEKLSSNYCGWKAGFPDLVIWNDSELKCKFVEVKGPGDTLSPKQTLWLQYLDSLGASTELCEIKAVTKKQ